MHQDTKLANNNRYSKINSNKSNLSKRSYSMPNRPASTRSSGGKNNNVHVAFGHRVYPAS